MNRLLSLLLCLLLGGGTMAQSVDLQWIGQQPPLATGVSWGVPFKPGEVAKGQQFALRDASGTQTQLQSWPMAWHADGSVKWMGLAAALSPERMAGLQVVAIKKPIQAAGITSREEADRIVVENGLGQIVFGRSGAALIRSINAGPTEVAANGRLVMMLQEGEATQDFESKIESATLEQSGPVRAVVRIEGKHKALDGSREWLPFTVRFYVYYGVAPIRMVHSIVFDGDAERDFIRGLGVRFELPLREEPHNRHVRFSGEGEGLWAEPVQPLFGSRRVRIPDAYENQVAGKRIPNKAEMDEQSQFLLDNWAIWSDYRLAQLSPDGFTIRKRTGSHSAWIGTAGSHRSSGLVLAGDVTGGLAVSLKNFWQSYPAELEATGMGGEHAGINVWLWSPRGEAMDMRYYDLRGHNMEAVYEGWSEGMATPYGVARTSELTLFPFAELPSHQQTARWAEAGSEPLQLMATPQYLHAAGAFGIWSLPDRSHPLKAWIEEQIDQYIAFYRRAIDDHKWYGFWNHGDVMHSYNTGRHMWNYDEGGFAWANTELSPDIWLWLAFIRSGRPDIFTMAQNMARHTAEVDMYHIGPMQGLGSRHNVIHWGDSGKEGRIGQAWLRRYSYYMTTDERMGDVMRESLDADRGMVDYDPLRNVMSRSKFPSSQPARLRWGPDWIAFAGNWFVEWERTLDPKYLAKIRQGMSDLAALPNGLYTGTEWGVLGYDPETGKIVYEDDPALITNSNHLANLMGGFESLMEMLPAVDHRAFTDHYLQYAKWYAIPRDHPIRQRPENARYVNWWGHWNHPRLMAFAAKELGEDQIKELAWQRFLAEWRNPDGSLRRIDDTKIEIAAPLLLYPMEENARVSTNAVSQWNINAIMLLELAGDKIPEK